MAALAARNAWPLSCAMIDVDNFKAINDTWGHKVGDGVLRRSIELCPLFSTGKQRIPVTISLGVAGEQCYDLETCIAEADQALYRAKREGHNRVGTLRAVAD